MIKEAIAHLLAVGKSERAEITEIDGFKYFMTNEGLTLLKKPRLETRALINVTTLDSIVDYVNERVDKGLTDVGKYIIHIKTPTSVSLYSQCFDQGRDHFMESKAIVPEFRFGNWFEPDTFIINMMANFEETPDMKKIFAVVGNIKEENVKNVSDNGVTQTVVARQGVSMATEVIVPNPVLLKPYRTFIEVEQPESAFVFRLKDGPQAALFDADGGAWRIEAMHNISQYIAETVNKDLVHILV